MLTYTDLIKGFDFGPWHVVPERDLIIDGEDERHIEPIVMNVFVVLASHGGGVVTRDHLIDAVWDGRPQADEVITRCISALRRSLGDDAKTPKYIETLQKRGYRVMQRVRLPDATEPESRKIFSVRPLNIVGIGLAAVVALVIYQFLVTKPITPTIESVAVYPFDCQFDPSDPVEHLCLGFAEESISGLQRIRGLRVIKMRRPYDGTPPNNVHGVVSGSVQIINNQVRIRALLEDARDKSTICCDSFGATQANIFDVQQEVADELTIAIDPGAISSPPAVSNSKNFEARMAYSYGRHYFEKRDHESTIDAIAKFEQAIDLDRNYGSAWLALAYSYVNWPDYDFNVDREAMYDKALDVIGEGIGANPGIEDAAGTVYGFVYHKRNRWIAAADAFETAINAETEQPMAYHWYSYMLASVGRLDVAMEHALHALELDPQNPAIISRVAITALYNNDHGIAGHYFGLANDKGLENFGHFLMYSLYLYRDGRIDEAKEIGKRAFELNDVDAGWFDVIIDGSREPDKRGEALQVLNTISADENLRLPKNVEMFFWMMLEDVERAMAIARRLENEVGLYEPELLFTREFEAMRQHREFDDITKAIGMSEYWSSAGCAWTDDSVHCQD